MPGPARIVEERIVVDGVSVHVRRTRGEGEPVVLAHGNPTDSGDWVPFMERLRRPSVAFDMPGWGRSERPPPSTFDATMRGQAAFHARCLSQLGVGRHALVVHDWGGLALIAAIARPEGVERLVIVNSVPLLPGYRWHWIARWFWRVPVLGELFNLGISRPAMRLLSRQATARPGPLPEEYLDRVVTAWGSPRSRPHMLALYRSGDPAALAAAGQGLGALDCPALVAWGQDDLYLPPWVGRAYAERLPHAELMELEGAGHWPWVDRPELVDRVVAFLDESP